MVGTTVLNPTTGIKGPIIACTAAPGDTTGPYQSLCVVPTTAALWGCKNASGCTVAADWAAAGGGGSSLITVVANTGDGTISAANLQKTVLTNTGASGTVSLTLGSATCTVGQAFTAYVTTAQAIKLIPYTGDRIQILTDAVNNSITSDAVVGSFVSLTCLAAGNWYLTGMNGAWTDTN